MAWESQSLCLAMYPWFQNKDKVPEVAPFHPRPGMTKTKKSHMGICVIYVFHSQHDVYNLYLKYLFKMRSPSYLILVVTSQLFWLAQLASQDI